MLGTLKDVDCSLLTPPTKEQALRYKKVLTEIVSMIKYMGNFFSCVLIYLYTGQPVISAKSEFHTLSLMMNSMLIPKFTFYRYAMFLSKVLILADSQRWFQRRRDIVRTRQAFNDLAYLNKHLKKEERRDLIRQNSKRTITTTTLQHLGSLNELPPMEPYDQGIFGGQTMDIYEFCSHLELHVNLDLDEIFSSDLKHILEYFKTVDEFFERIFWNTELEIKIDLMRLILRMTKATKFVNTIYLLNAMNVDFLNECQIFALFCQVLLAEIRK